MCAIFIDVSRHWRTDNMSARNTSLTQTKKKKGWNFIIESKDGIKKMPHSKKGHTVATIQPRDSSA